MILLKYEWDWGLNYCHVFRFMPASIETEEDHQLITNFLNTSTNIDDEFRCKFTLDVDAIQI